MAEAEGGEKILVVEDSATQAEKLRYILQKHRYQVSVAKNASAALDMISHEKPSLIISDIIMPEMDGYELCRRIKAHDEYCEIRIILLTSLSDPRDVIKGLECGADNFITKPYEEADLVSRIDYLLENRYQQHDCASLPGLKIVFGGREYVITSGRHQILDLLLSTYETAIRKNNELMRAQEEMHALNEKLKAANHDLEAFAFTISHDLRGPLNNIHGSCQVIEQLYAGALNEQCREFFRYINVAAENMDKLIDTILRFSIQSRHELHRETVDLSAMARDIVADPLFREPHRSVTFSLADGITAEGDRELLRVALENLLGNAWKYTSTTENAVIEFGLSQLDGSPAYFVRDNGVGFDMSDADRLFTPFQRLHAHKGVDGFGIGLSTVQRIIQRHGGRVWAEGEVGGGAVFYFTLNPLEDCGGDGLGE